MAITGRGLGVKYTFSHTCLLLESKYYSVCLANAHEKVTDQHIHL